MYQLATTTDSRQTVKNALDMLDHIVKHLKAGADTLEEPTARCLLDTTRGVLEGLMKSMQGYERLVS